MGYKLFRKEVKLCKNQEFDFDVILQPENRAAIHGVVKLSNQTPVKDAVVKLFKKGKCDPCDLIPVTFTFTDECGQFLFGVDSGVEYVIKVFYFKPETCKPIPPKNCDCDCDE